MSDHDYEDDGAGLDYYDGALPAEFEPVGDDTGTAEPIVLDMLPPALAAAMLERLVTPCWAVSVDFSRLPDAGPNPAWSAPTDRMTFAPGVNALADVIDKLGREAADDQLEAELGAALRPVLEQQDRSVHHA